MLPLSSRIALANIALPLKYLIKFTLTAYPFYGHIGSTAK